MSVPKTKYRPVLTAEQIQHIIHLAKNEKPSISSESISVISVLAPFEAKIANAAITPAYETKPKVSLLSTLGGEDRMNNPPKIPNLTKEQRWELAYRKYKAYPDTCTVQDILDAKEYMYLNDLMSPEEQEAFEREADPVTEYYPLKEKSIGDL